MSHTRLSSVVRRDVNIRPSELSLALCSAAGINPAIVTRIEFGLNFPPEYMHLDASVTVTFYISVDVDDSTIHEDVTALKTLLNPFVKDE